jgi:hypothetical protein
MNFSLHQEVSSDFKDSREQKTHVHGSSKIVFLYTLIETKKRDIVMIECNKKDVFPMTRILTNVSFVVFLTIEETKN